MLNLPIFSNHISSLIFVLSILIVGIFFYLLLKFYNFWSSIYPSSTPITDTDEYPSIPMTNPILNKVSIWRSKDYIKYRLIQDEKLNYWILVKFDMNDIVKMQDLIKNKEKNINTKVPLNQQLENISNKLDQTTENGVINDWYDTSMFNNIFKNTNILFNLTPSATNTSNAVNALTQENINQLFGVVDNIDLKLNINKLMMITIKDRIIVLKIPIQLINLTDKVVTFKYQPDLSKVMNNVKGDPANSSIMSIDINYITINTPSNNPNNESSYKFLIE